jgi:3-oxoacyl-[acyl-carrier protein] reductase
VVASSWPVWPWASVPLRPGSCPMQATKGAVKMFTQALSREVGSRGHYNQQRRAGPMDTDLNPASADWAVPQKAATALNRRAR